MRKEIVDKLKERLVTSGEFNEILDKIMSTSIDELFVLYELHDGKGRIYKFGRGGENDPVAIMNIELQGGFNAKINLWCKSDDYNIEDYKKLFYEYWNTENCDSDSGLPVTKTEAFIKKCNRTLSQWKNTNKKIAVFMIDLDHFGEINAKYGHSIGSKVILDFSKLLFSALNKNSILLHQSGDEFNIILIYEEYNEVLELAHKLYITTKGEKFDIAPDVDVTMSMGIWLVDNNGDDFIKNRENAEKAYNPERKKETKKRDSVRVDKDNNLVSFGNYSLKLAISRIIALNKSNMVFHNIYIDYISYYVSQLNSFSSLSQEINSILSWVKPYYLIDLRCTSEDKMLDTEANFSKVEVGLSVFHGMLRNEKCNIQKFKLEINNVIRITDENQSEIFCMECGDSGEDIVLEIDNLSVYRQVQEVRRIILVQGGYTTKLEVPKDVFYKIESVDARPTVGGGLPDFWEATIASLISSMNENSFMTDILIYGDIEHTANVASLLQSISDWTEETINQIAKKTYKTHEDVLKFKEKFKNNIRICIDETDVIDEIYKIQTNFISITSENINSIYLNRRFMERSFQHDAVSLNILDGCSVNTIAEAFPIVLEIIRKFAKEEKAIVDQAGRELVELTNFKILLKTPSVDKIPGYYSNSDELENYYRRVFEKDGLFRKRLDKEHQVEKMIDHVISVIDGERPYATRRAILIIQNEMSEDGIYSPLGLVSIWLAPRYEGENVIIDYSFTWRTVEAMVGLPFSMYASVRFAEYIFEILCKESRGQKNIKLGEVSYNAYSLHMFLDDERINIARGIINEVSV